jgi:hypothetical protein
MKKTGRPIQPEHAAGETGAIERDASPEPREVPQNTMFS